ncbi:MAG TPA: GtrA family protein [Candidatus Nanoarchaeia archaeon]|nr:GtrA family protein [Candidatus Nanoarchaeia archaeon]
MKIVSEVGRSIIIGISGTVLNLVLLYLLTDIFHIYYLYSAIITNIIAMLYIFLGDKYYTFIPNNGALTAQFTKYFIVYFLSNALSIGLLAFFVESLVLHHLVAQAIATTLVSFVTFLIFKYWIFKSY